MEMRELKALELAARSKIVWNGEVWLVPSQNRNGTYKVTTWPGAERCECDDFALRQEPCKHIIAARLVEERDGRREAPPIVCDEVPKKPTYSRDWKAYTLAQTTEKHRLQALLADLCDGVPEPEYNGGRRAVPIADRLFGVALKVYSTFSCRRSMCDLEDAYKRGYLSQRLHHTKLSHVLCDADLTEPLKQLVARSALPLRMVDTDFAVDSSGFSVARFVRWTDEKYGKRSGRDWVKVHVCTGVKTGVVTAVEIKDRDAADSPLLPGLVNATAASGFAMREVSADKGYLSVENVDTIAAVGAEPFIAPKINTTGGKGGLFERMYHYYAFRREEFLRHYHKRSNVEACFSAVKRKFGDHVRSRNDVAMVNEVLCKFLCNNLCCVILSQVELGIEAAFWDADAEGLRDVIPLLRRG
jgi:transposase